MSLIREHQARPAATSDLPQGTLALIARATAEQHQAILELQRMFQRRGGILSRHFLSQAVPKEDVFMLDECKSFTVVNFSAITVQVAFGGTSSSAGGAMPVQEYSWIQIPTDVNTATLAAEASALAGVGQAMVFFIRYENLMPFGGGTLSGSTGGGSGARETAAAVTSESPRSVKVKVTSTSVIAANATRKGLSVENTGTVPISLGLGAAAVAGDDIVLEPAGSWDGTISGTLFTGAVNAIAGSETTLAVVEV